jgi:hypothetical protein
VLRLEDLMLVARVNTQAQDSKANRGLQSEQARMRRMIRVQVLPDGASLTCRSNDVQQNLWFVGRGMGGA